MKKLAAIAFLVAYVAVSIGVSVNLHYCDGSLTSIAVQSSGSNCCCNDEAAENDCCDDEVVFMQMKNHHKPPTHFKLQQVFLPGLQVIAIPFTGLTAEASVIVPVCNNSAPPDNPIWLINCTLTYYG